MNFGSDRISFSWYREPSYGNMSHADSRMYMLHDDLLGNLFNARRSGDSKVILSPDTKETRQAFLAFFFSKRAWAHELLDAVQETVGNIAHSMYQDGKAFYEIVHVQEFPGTYIYELDEIRYESYKIKGKQFIQIIPQDIALENDVDVKFSIPLSKILQFHWPEKLGGSKSLISFKKKLYKMYELDPMFGFLDSPLQNEAAYDMNLHRKSHDERLWKLTGAIHWLQRKAMVNDDFFTEFYYLHRGLLFRRNQILLRDHILEVLRQGFESIWDESEQVHLGLELSPSLVDIDKAIADWKSGDYDLDFIKSVLH